MNTNEIMKIVTDYMKEQGKGIEEISQMELCIQYLCNADFRKALNDYVFEQTYNPNK